MKKVAPASTVDAPVLDKETALLMPEFAEGKKAARDGVSLGDCPYAIFRVAEQLTSAEWRLAYENRFQAWMYGYNEHD